MATKKQQKTANYIVRYGNVYVMRLFTLLRLIILYNNV